MADVHHISPPPLVPVQLQQNNIKSRFSYRAKLGGSALSKTIMSGNQEEMTSQLKRVCSRVVASGPSYDIIPGKLCILSLEIQPE